MHNRFIGLQHARASGAGQDHARPGHSVSAAPTRRWIVCATAIVAIVTIAGCSRSDSGASVVLEATRVVVLRPEWAVIADPYVRVHESPDRFSPIRGHLRAGDVTEVTGLGTGLTIVDGRAYRWYRIDHPVVAGWVFGRELLPARSRNHAINLAYDLTENE
ncbi:MAG: hypothetical protein EA382_09905 [Spirochaetaceae bacterium]|nr:MAG: hypothetical protein EA382_09905 [Spirochaetaceae bacterium]